jgi:hypothetical protein
VKGRKAFFSEEKKQKTFMSLSRAYPAPCTQETKVFSFFFSKKNCLPCLICAMAICVSNAALAQKPAQNCVDVTVGNAQSYDCINQQLGALAAQQHRAAAAETDAPYSATSPANVTGQFDEAATRNRLGRNFGHSVTPERPAANVASPLPR